MSTRALRAAGVNAIPRNAVFVPAVAMLDAVPLIAALYPAESVIEWIAAPLVVNRLTVEPETDPTKPLTVATAAELFSTHDPPTSEYLPTAFAASSATYNVSTPATPVERSARKNAYGPPVEDG